MATLAARRGDTRLNGAIQEWLESQAERVSTRQRAQQDSAKLLATFASGVGAAVVGTALQVAAGKIAWADFAGAGLLALSVALALVVVFSDRLKEPDHEKCIVDNVGAGRTQEELLGELRRAVLLSIEVNERFVAQTRCILISQILVSLGCVAFGLVSLLIVHRAG